jgi:hypothetical protein
MKWIETIKSTLGIEAELSFDTEQEFGEPTNKLIHEVCNVGGNIYVTNPDAKNKYLDEQFMKQYGIKVEYCKVPKHLQIHVFEAFEKWGIDGTIKQMPRRICQKQLTS